MINTARRQAIAAAFARAVLGAVLVLLAAASMLWAGVPGPVPAVARLAVMCVVIAAAVLAWHALQPGETAEFPQFEAGSSDKEGPG